MAAKNSPTIGGAPKAAPKAAPAPTIQKPPAPVIKPGQPPPKPPSQVGPPKPPTQPQPPVTKPPDFFGSLYTGLTNAAQGILNNPYAKAFGTGVQAGLGITAPTIAAGAKGAYDLYKNPTVQSGLNYYAQQAQKYVQQNAPMLATAGSIAAHTFLPPGLAQIMDIGLGATAYGVYKPEPGKSAPKDNKFGKKDTGMPSSGEKKGQHQVGNKGWESGLTAPPMIQATVAGDGGGYNENTPNYDYGGYGDWGGGYGGRGGGGGGGSYGGGFGLTQWRIRV